MSRKIIAGNWKMNGNKASVAALLQGISDINIHGKVIIFPPFLFIPDVQQQLTNSTVAWGGQNLSAHEQGAFTGEISGAMLNDFGCSYVLVGHSERRTLYGETNHVVAEKFIAAQQATLTPVLCVGETLEQREAKQTQQVVAAQLDAVIQAAGVSAFTNAVVAYEPVWAIGTGLTATPEQAQQVHQQIREQIAQKDAKIANQISILYGGSVKADNAAELFAQSDIDGGLVGGASLDAQSFKAICEA